MRAFKFRAFDSVQKKYLWPYPDGFNIFGEVTCFDLIEQQVRKFAPEGSDVNMRINDVIIEQFTGLYDKNGKEIYEGDIIKIPDNYDAYGMNAGEIYEIYFRFGGFRLKPKYSPISKGFWFEYDKTVNIIGNIHENPELLK